MNRTVYLNGDYLPETEAKVSIFDRGFSACGFPTHMHQVAFADVYPCARSVSRHALLVAGNAGT